MRRKSLMAAIAGLLTVVACTTTPPPAKTESAAPVDTAAIRKAGQERLTALTAGNLNGYLAAYADDAVWMPPGVEDVVGKEVSQKRLAGVMETVGLTANIETVEQVVLSPDWVLERGKYTVVRTQKAGGSSETEVGSYLTVWKRQPDQGFKIAYDMWHSDRPFAGEEK